MDDWQPPGKDCGACGAKCCGDFVIMVDQGTKARTDCPFYGTSTTTIGMDTPVHAATDVCGRAYDFIIGPLIGEPSARKIILPFRADLVERWKIVPGDIVIGRPMGQGCPVQHVSPRDRSEPGDRCPHLPYGRASRGAARWGKGCAGLPCLRVRGNGRSSETPS